MFSIARALLLLLPGWVTQSIQSGAEREVRRGLANNEVRQELDYGWLYRFLLWGGIHPLLFSGLVATSALVTAAAVAATSRFHPFGISLPALPLDYEHAAFLGVPWTVQATLLALVYPLVLTFTALIAQRRTSSGASVAVYLLDSGIVPSGSSSVLLVISMSAEYFLAPFLPAKCVPASLAFNGAWLLLNLALTGHFLLRTIQFVQDEASRSSYLRLAVVLVLKNEFVLSLKAHALVNASRLDETPERTGVSKDPRVLMFRGFDKGRQMVTRRVQSQKVLSDVYLRPLTWVTKRWLARAGSSPDRELRRPPTLCFPVQVGEEVSGRVDLCRVQDGPSLTLLERALVQTSFVFRKRRWSPLPPTCLEMLSELAAEVEALAASQRYADSREVFLTMLRMHATLLRSCEEADKRSNAATMAYSPYGWGPHSFHRNWIGAYRSVTTKAIELLMQDQTLFKSVAQAAASLVRAASSVPDKLAIESLDIPQYLSFQLGEWWSRHAQALSVEEGASITLPGHTGASYQDAVVHLAGGLNDFTVGVVESEDERVVWNSHCNRGRAYLAHIEVCARLLIRAVDARDKVAATWFSDLFLKWWGVQQYEMEHGHLDYHPNFASVRISLLGATWDQAQDELLMQTGAAVDIHAGKQAIALAVRRHWEAMRTTVCALLLTDDATGRSDSLRLSVAASLFNGRPFHEGGSAEARTWNDADELLAHLLDLCFGDATTTGRLNAFCDRGFWGREGPMVSGWMYGGSVPRTDLESMTAAFGQMLLALPTARRPSWTDSRKTIDNWWRDTIKLDQISRFANGFKELVASRQFRPHLQAVSTLRADRPAAKHRDRIVISRALRTIAQYARRERNIMLRSIVIPPKTVSSMSQRLGRFAFAHPGVALEAYKFCTVVVSPQGNFHEQSLELQNVSKEELTSTAGGKSDEYLLKLAKEVRRLTVERAFEHLAAEHALVPILDEGAGFITAVAGACDSIRAAGSQAMVLVASYDQHRALQPRDWQAEEEVPLPGVTLRRVQREGESAEGQINDAPIVRFGTPSRKCYVVPMEVFTPLTVRGKSADEALSGSLEVVGDNSVVLTWVWAATLHAAAR